jgi:hypothetical protein
MLGTPEISGDVYAIISGCGMKARRTARQTNTFKGFIITIPFLLN